MIFIKYLIFIFCLAFVVFFILAYVQGKKQRQKAKAKQALFFEKIKNNKPILKISDEVYYFKGAYLTEEFFIFNRCKVRHYKDLHFINQLLLNIALQYI